jgi:hypothetical protein
MAVECDAGLSAAQWPFESSFANLVRLAPQILAIELKQVKSAESDGVVVLPPFRIISNTERPFSSQAIASPSTTQDRAGRPATAAKINGNRPLKSCPLRVMRRTLSASR